MVSDGADRARVLLRTDTHLASARAAHQRPHAGRAEVDMTPAPPPGRATWVLPLVSAAPQALLLLLLCVGIGYDIAGAEPGLLVKTIVGIMIGPPVMIAYTNYRRRARLLELQDAHTVAAQLSGSHRRIGAITGRHDVLSLEEGDDDERGH